MVGRKFVTAALAMLACAGLALAQEQKRAPSPPGTASTMVGGTWSAPDKDGERNYSGGKWIEVIYSRPMLRGRTDIFGKGADYGKTVNAGAPVWRAGANAATKLKTEVPIEIGGKKLAAGRVRPVRGPEGRRLDAHRLDAAHAGEVRRERQDEDLGLLRVRLEVRRRPCADEDGHAAGFGGAVHDRLRRHDRIPAGSSRWSGRRPPGSCRLRWRSSSSDEGLRTRDSVRVPSP